MRPPNLPMPPALNRVACSTSGTAPPTVLVEGFQEDAAEAHVNSEHFKKATELFPTLLVETPTIINTLIPGKTEWDEMAEFKVN